jgi:hypothetical protein
MPAYAGALASPGMSELVAYLLSLQHSIGEDGDADRVAP